MNVETNADPDDSAESTSPLIKKLQAQAVLSRNQSAPAMADLLEEAAAALSYYRAGLLQERPAYLPRTVWITSGARGDGPFRSTKAGPGEYAAHCNQWGAVSVCASNGQMLGLGPQEFEVISWTPNQTTEDD